MIDPLASPKKTNVVAGMIMLGIGASLLTMLTAWIGLTAYPIPIVASLGTFAASRSSSSAGSLSAKQVVSVWGAAALASIITMGIIVDEPIVGAESNISSNRVPELVTAPLPTPVTVGTTTPIGEISNYPAKILVTNIDEILDDFDSNQIAATKKYGGTPFQLTGKVIRVREAFGTGILVLASPKSGITHEFGFSDRGTEKLADIKVGDTVVVSCPEALEAMSLVIVGGCSDVAAK